MTTDGDQPTAATGPGAKPAVVRRRYGGFVQFGRYGGETAGTFKADLLHLLQGDDGSVVGVHRNTGTRNGKQLDVLCCTVFEFRNGRIVAGREHFFDLYAWDEFWS